ncbi:hypothetical protein [Jonesia quinghaiensis]|uniref:hypothetical protein n=1 Tax=Jonesia quinghaiensis TaxID=262806 RepID=UPI000414EA13|nr:hypothetical protein [Jonesia quinghaiensis]
MGIDDLVNKAKNALARSDGTVAKLKAAATDERIDTVATQMKKVAPDAIDGHIDTLARKAKQANDEPPQDR